VFPDAQPFMRWAREKGLTVGIVSNAEYRYKEVILPALGLNQVLCLLYVPYSFIDFFSHVCILQSNTWLGLANRVRSGTLGCSQA
jgi:hypothetical protein